MVVDTSIILAIFFDEPASLSCVKYLQKHSDDLMMSTVNYAEALIQLRDRQPLLLPQIQERIEFSALQLVPPSAAQAELAAWARHRFPLNLGDCFAYALAKEQDCPLLTLDRDFRKTDVKVIIP